MARPAARSPSNNTGLRVAASARLPPPAQQGIHLGSTGRDLADGHRVLRAAARPGAGPAGRGLCPHGRQRRAGRSDHKAVLALNAGTLTAVDAARAKLWATEVQHRVPDRCLQLFGGYGYMAEYPIARAYADARVQTIYGGTSEIMKTIIARQVTGLRA